ncbi:long-chain acyl-CoA synthetase [Actimicrobium sp. GrIS 1.19]|uniref:alpha/beta fold hydrolase n=1 Tax=Actimicrobium sp. GrIS 1.19 TaxID=3071708 RepID=UPI002E055E85|nr:long-chain acyl-CoA synthetase [Actimicrobium sp. GrIS 1.19]
MPLDPDLHRHTLKLPQRLAGKPLEMSVVEAGARDAAQTMVFLHGFGGRAAYWQQQLDHFQSDYRVIALDLRGHGYSDAPDADAGARYDVDELLGDIDAALAALAVPQQFILIAHSFGGALAAAFIARHPQRVSALVLIASAVRFRLRLAGRLLLRVPPTLLERIFDVMPLLGFPVARIYPPAHVVYLQNRNGVADWDGTDYLRAIKVPTLVILGHRDALFSDRSYRDVARLIPGAEEVVVPVSAHQVMVERPDAVNRAIDRFLQSHTDPLLFIAQRAALKLQRRNTRKLLEAERPWLKHYDARTPYQIKPPTVSLPRLLEATARRFGATPATRYFGAALSWQAIDRLSNRFAHGLLALRIKPGEAVLLALPNCPQWIIAYFGILKIGAVAVLSDARSTPELLLERIADTDTVALITSSDRYDALRAPLQDDPRAAGLRRVVFASLMDYRSWREAARFAAFKLVQHGHWLPRFRQDEKNRKPERRFIKFGQVLARGRNTAPEQVVEIGQIAVIVYTWGNGGNGLPVPLSHGNLASNALQLRHWLPESRPGDERFLAQQPLSTAYGLTGLLHLAVYLGATMILLPDDELPQLLRTVRKMRPTYFPTTPEIVRQLAHSPGVRRYGLASIRVCAVSGSPLPREIREEFEKITRGRLFDAYGLTEASPAVLAMPLAARHLSGVVGVPLPDTEVRIVDLDSGMVLGADGQGELQVRGPQVFAGYGGRDQRLLALSTQRLHDGWLATGDIASMDEDGYVSIIDRRKNMLVRSGHRVFPRQIEEILFEHPAVASARVRFESDEVGVMHLRATVVLHRNMVISETELLEYCAKRLHASALPDSICVE